MLFDRHNFSYNSALHKLCLNRLLAGQCTGVVQVQVEFLRQETSNFISLCGRQSVRTLTQLSTRLGATCRSIQKASWYVTWPRSSDSWKSWLTLNKPLSTRQWTSRTSKSLSKLNDNTLNTHYL